jgi:prepilin-type N-terminal cleavage/methylation domain-containing protein/prepilin-type processing-associated H-X9-DG protein
MRQIRNGFTLIEILVVIGIIAILMGILLPSLEHVRHNGYMVKCAANLQQIGEGLRIYTNENHGQYPRTVFTADAPLVKGTGGAAPDPFGAGGPSANDQTSPLFLLLRTQKLPTSTMICPYNDVNVYTPEVANVNTRSNFTNYVANLGYSYANPYPSTAASKKDYRLTDRLSSQFAIMADLNPGPKGYEGNLNSVTPQSASSEQEEINSKNHEGDGQNVLYADGHVAWCNTVFVGMNGDNIYTTQDGQIEASPATTGDSVLLPAQ